MAVPSWAIKFARRRAQKCRYTRQLLSKSSSHKPLEVVMAANLRCTQCQKRVADVISRIDDVESIVVHVLDKKVTVARRAIYEKK